MTARKNARIFMRVVNFLVLNRFGLRRKGQRWRRSCQAMMAKPSNINAEEPGSGTAPTVRVK